MTPAEPTCKSVGEQVVQRCKPLISSHSLPLKNKLSEVLSTVNFGIAFFNRLFFLQNFKIPKPLTGARKGLLIFSVC